MNLSNRILDKEYIRINEPVTRSDIETLLGIDNKKAMRILNKLIDKGVIMSQGKSRGITYSVSGQFLGQSVYIIMMHI